MDQVYSTYQEKEKIDTLYFDAIKKSFKPNNILKTNILGYVSNNPTFSYERVLSKRLSVHITYGIGNEQNTNGEVAKDEYLDKYHGYALDFRVGDFKHNTQFDNFWGIGINIYFPFEQKIAPNGFHIGNSFNFYRSFEAFTIHDENDGERRRSEVELNFTTINFDLGYQILALKYISFEAILSPGLALIEGYEKRWANIKNISDRELIMAFSLNIGIAFGVKKTL